MTCLLLAQDTQVKIVCVSDLLVIIVQRFLTCWVVQFFSINSMDLWRVSKNGETLHMVFVVFSLNCSRVCNILINGSPIFQNGFKHYYIPSQKN